MSRKGLGFRLAAVSVLAAAVSACSMMPQNSWFGEDKVEKFTVLHTNDHHGRFWTSRKGEWGMAARMTLVSQVRAEVEAEGGHVLLLSGGDINTGVPESDLQDAIPDFKGMNLLGYDAMAVGNHEFDNSSEVLKMQQDLAEFPFLSANIVYKANGEHAFKPYTTFELGDITVGVMGLTTTDTPKQSNPENMKGLEFISPVEAARKLLPELQDETDVIIALTHMGHYQNGDHGVNAPGDVTLARSVDGIDLIVGGHSQDPLFKPDLQNNTLIVQAQDWGRYVGRADFEYRDGKLSLLNYELIPVNHKGNFTFAQDEKMLKLLTPYQEKGAKLVEQQVGSVDERLAGDRNEVRFGYTNLGRLITSGMMSKANADLAVMNSGGIRASIDAGEITYRDILTVAPFGNGLAYVDMSGKEVVEYLKVVAAKPTNSGAFAHFNGVEMKIDGEKVDVIKIGGKSVDMDKTYRMALLNFSAKGGDNYPNVSEHPGYVDTGYIDADVLREYVEKMSPLKVSDFVPAGIERR
ncbi:bifunctional UDP-sugar hydrolase/5'-nucleotidase UshA [Parendozoicomonas haliclonae]|uniref:Trifunctional nucleotide phosphoesterase protein YfkN n=1 Tax=Parendozoicomonas haliclonae TaxID=1960125 RepID=A0A1X7APP8_9GAMM|nr:bifunctional UDP-sugar hydrolase/5'-nucleotidase UshA [Parendozoicomonas haliclonae]SMA50092.1 Trifunctional nucleotide phosphoesterase protein YfkN precursor [Parendozoicomonas haliclonae]